MSLCIRFTLACASASRFTPACMCYIFIYPRFCLQCNPACRIVEVVDAPRPWVRLDRAVGRCYDAVQTTERYRQ